MSDTVEERDRRIQNALNQHGYPGLTRDDIRAAICFAADTIAHEEVVFVRVNDGDRHD